MIPRIHVVFVMLSSVLVLATIVWGIRIVGSPSTARLRRLDRQRVDDLRTIHREVQSLCQDPDIKNELKRDLPDSLDELASMARSERINRLDPLSGEAYEYRVIGPTRYEVCATFASSRPVRRR